MKANYPKLLLVFVPANCTGVMQTGDLLYNCPLKHHFASEHMAYLTSYVSEQMENGEDVQNTKFDTAVGNCACCAMRWLLAAFDAVRSVNLEGCLQSVGYAKCVDNDAVGKHYQNTCWKKCYTGAADGVDRDAEVIEEEPRLDMSPSAEHDHLPDLQQQNADTEQDQFYEDG